MSTMIARPFLSRSSSRCPRRVSHGRCAADIYSLGVCLVETGLWDTFVIYSAEGVAEAPGAALELTFDEVRRQRPSSIRKHLVALAKHRLPRTMGEVYTEVVVSRLTCLDEDNTEYANDEESGDGRWYAGGCEVH